MKILSFAIVLVALQLGMVGCDHLRAKDASAEQAAKSEKTSTAPASLVPPSDRYGANAGAAQH
jgi:hypothetical protein